jgi:hypothetical protein
MSHSNELQIGKAGEYIVCADVIMMGLIAYPSEQGLPYDVVIDNGTRLLKCQVKTTREPRKVPQRSSDTSAYIFNIKRHGKNFDKRYTKKDVDLFALVELQNKSVIYITNDDMPETINIRVDSLKGQYYDEKGIADYKKAKELHQTIKNKSEIGRIMGLAPAAVCRMLEDGFVPHETKARYWSDYKKGKEWFCGI